MTGRANAHVVVDGIEGAGRLIRIKIHMLSAVRERLGTSEFQLCSLCKGKAILISPETSLLDLTTCVVVFHREY
jgi:hypothetical protein